MLAEPPESSYIGEARVLKGLLVAAIAIGLLLGGFAWAGQRLSLWDPIPPQRLAGERADGRNGSSPTGLAEKASGVRASYSDQTRPGPGPPLTAETAFLIAGVAAAVGVLGITFRKLLKIARLGPWILDVSAPKSFFPLKNEAGDPHESRRRGALIAARVRPHPFHLDIAPQARADGTFYGLAIAAGVAIGLLVGLGAR